ncbi:MAG TPA: hypothetical protein VMT58_07885 [Candidatus Binataceae bacterium]|nr:hypothetical protein [Candidatus Binataceae bacterium]
MRAAYSVQFVRQLDAAPARIKRAFAKQLVFLLDNLRHPSLDAKKYDAARDLWQARVNGGWRFYFRIEGDCYFLESIRPHPK